MVSPSVSFEAPSTNLWDCNGFLPCNFHSIFFDDLTNSVTCLLAYFACVAGHVASRMVDLRVGLYCVAVTASLRDSWVSLTIYSAQRSGGVLLGGAMMTVGWRSECRWLGCRVADGICVRSHLGAVYGLLSLVGVVRCRRVLRRS